MGNSEEREPRVIPHKRPEKTPRSYKEPKPKRYVVEKYSHNGGYWHFVRDCRFKHNAKSWARYYEDITPGYQWRVVDRKDRL